MLAFFLISSRASIYGVSRWKCGFKLALAVYCLSYTVSTVVGATLISLGPSRALWLAFDGGLDSSLLQEFDSFKYMFLLYSPLIICPLVFFAFSKVKPVGVTRRLTEFITGMEVNLYAFVVVWTLLFGYCFADLALN